MFSKLALMTTGVFPLVQARLRHGVVCLGSDVPLKLWWINPTGSLLKTRTKAEWRQRHPMQLVTRGSLEGYPVGGSFPFGFPL